MSDRTSMNHYPRDGASESPLIIESREDPLRRRILTLHDFGSWIMSKVYEIEGQLLIYHEARSENPLRGDGHVENVVKFSELLLAARRYFQQHDPERKDPLALHEQVNRHMRWLQSSREKQPKDNHVSVDPDMMSALDAWKKMTDQEREDVIPKIFLRAGEFHDVGNFVEAVNDWNALKDEGKNPLSPVNLDDPNSPPVVKFYDRQQYDDVEVGAAKLFTEELDAFENDTGLTLPQRSVAKVIGAEMIRRTEFIPTFLRQGERPEQTIDALARADRFASMVNSRGPLGVMGLVNENRVRLVNGDQMDNPTFSPHAYFGGFIPWQFEMLDQLEQKPKGTSMKVCLEYLSDYKRANEDEFAEILGIPSDRKGAVRHITDFGAFVHDRLAMQQAVADLLWPGKTSVRFDEAFSGWDKARFQQVVNICRIYQENFWNPAYTVEQFQRQIASIAPDRR